MEILGLEEQEAVLPREASAGAHLVPEWVQARVSKDGRTSLGSEHEYLQ